MTKYSKLESEEVGASELRDRRRAGVSTGCRWILFAISLSVFLISFFTFLDEYGPAGLRGCLPFRPGVEVSSFQDASTNAGDLYLLGVGKADITGYVIISRDF